MPGRNMNMRKRYTMFMFILLMLSSFMFSGCIGSPEFKIIFENKTQETLTIYYGDYKVGTVNPISQITYDRASWNSGRYPITAINLQGETVFSKTLTRDMMEKIETMVYKVLIFASDNTTDIEHSDNSTIN